MFYQFQRWQDFYCCAPDHQNSLNSHFSAHFFLKPQQPRESVGSEKPECDLIHLSSSLSTSQNRDIPIGCVKEQLLYAHKQLVREFLNAE